ncbi:MAG: DAHL domain-containing protein [Candidatus Competibacteraceae bacterium]|nr:DAHL domain-containing protein [Candidatus Competibacteraceae bacterium]
MTVSWRPIPIFAGLLLWLTYLLLQSESPDLALRARLDRMLVAFELHDTALDRHRVAVRAGWPPPHHYTLADARRDLLRAAADLQRESRGASPEAARLLSPQADSLTEAARRKTTVVEYFKSDSALLRNSLAYVVQTAPTLRARATVAEEQSVAAEVGALAILLLRFIQRPEPELGAAIEALLDRLARASAIPARFA